MKRSANGTLPNDGKNTGVSGSRLKRTIKSLIAISLLGVGLATLNVFTSRHDVAMATGEKSPAQHDWFVNAAERPDIAAFFKSLPHKQRVAMAQNIGRYDDAPLAKLIGKLLADFDDQARQALTESLKPIAATHPDAVANQFTQKGSFQILGVSTALRSQGPKVLPAVAEMLSNGDARPAAVAYLVSAGLPSVPVLVPKLQDASADVQNAAADALGQMRAKAAVVPLFFKLKNAKDTERAPFLAALAAIGDPTTELLMSDTLRNPQSPLGERTSAALGLGRISSPGAAKLLWQFATSDEPDLASGSLAALSVIGAPALATPGIPEPLRLQVAANVEGSESDTVIRNGLADTSLRLAAIRAAKDRPPLVPDLANLLPAVRKDGDLVAAIVNVLNATPEGRRRLAPFENDANISGFIDRARQTRQG